MRLIYCTIITAILTSSAVSRDESCKIELLNINQAVVDSACIPKDSTQSMIDGSVRPPVRYQVQVNGNCGAGVQDGQQLNPDNSLRKAGFC
ncbi:hypothetical protein CcaCcLH18_12280 [Colletotrichum camelliae]|nr:hypothetical protein CcaCcLH18_12280 [Colletotrichum camelliae]